MVEHVVYRESSPCLRRDVENDFFAIYAVGDADRCCLDDIGKFRDYIVDLQWRDVYPSSNNQVLGATGDEQKSVHVEIPDITDFEPATRMNAVGSIRVKILKFVLGAGIDRDCASFTRRKMFSVAVDDGKVMVR